MAIRHRVKKVFRWVGWGLAGLALLALAALAVFVLVILPRTFTGGHDVTPFQFDRKMEIERRAPDGTSYTVNNSTATFRLDVAKPDAHSRLVFTNYAAALAYCRERGLPTLPSVQLIQGKLKQFDDALCAALELAMAERRVQALTRLLDALKRETNEQAIVYVATALALAGAEPDVDAELKRRVEASRDEFLTTPEARPCGFWDASERLIRSFQSDRYLMQGLIVRDSPDACLALSRAVTGDPALSEAFRRLQAFGAALTNPASAISFEELAGLTPQEIARRYPSDARFALISYSVSKEQTLIDRLVREGKVNGDTCLMALVVDAVRSGRLKLEPRPDSGWFDYQWHALETLLAPERGRESAKLRLTDAYKKRLENAFATALAKARETQIKRLPIMTLGSMAEPDQPPPKVKVAPEFAAEPTLTVYLRVGRGYRFLRQALAATMGEEELARVQLAHSERSVDDTLRETAGLCYGLYDRLCLEIGRKPEYLSDELTAAELEEARAVFSRWRDMWQADPPLAADARVAAPVGRWPNGRTRYWGAAGVRLEPVVYEYLDKPEVSGWVEAEFAPCSVYLPTDLFLEFERLQPEPLTRAEFRKLCDVSTDVDGLRRTFVVAPPTPAETGVVAIGKRLLAYWGWAVVVSVALLCWRVRRARLWALLGGSALIAGWIVLMVASPVYRTEFVVRHVATINEPLGLLSEAALPHIPLEFRLRAFAALSNDPDPQIRYLSARMLGANNWWDEPAAESNAWHQAGVREFIKRVASDPSPDVAPFAIWALGKYHDRDTVDFLLERLKCAQAYDELCRAIILVLGECGDPRAIEALRPFCVDSRLSVRLDALRALGQFPQAAAQEQLWLFAESNDVAIRQEALTLVKKGCHAWWGEELDVAACETKCDAMLAERARKKDLPFEVRMSFARGIDGADTQVAVLADLLSSADVETQTNSVLFGLVAGYLDRCGAQVEQAPLSLIVTNAVARMSLAADLVTRNSTTIKYAVELLLLTAEDSPNPSVHGCAKRALEELQREPEPRERGQWHR